MAKYRRFYQIEIKNRLRDITVVVIVSLLSLITAELILQTTVGKPYELSTDNKISDVYIGHKVNSRLPEIDEFGFRNESGKYKNYELLAVGDSHTYGYNVEPDYSWPNRLEQLSGMRTYNVGIGGNGIYSYHYLVKKELEKSNKIIVALYLANDFMSDGYVCNIDFTNDFWIQEINRLDLNPPSCDQTSSSEQAGNITDLKTLLLNIANHSTLVSLIKNEIYVPVIYQPNKTANQELNVHPKLSGISINQLQKTMERTSEENKSVQTQLNDFLKMLNDWKKGSDQNQIGFVIIPSRQLIYRRYVEQDIEYAGPNVTELFKFTQNEVDLEIKLLNDVSKLNFPIISASYEVLDEFVKHLPRAGLENFYPDAGHPNKYGYEAYARVAHTILKQITNQ